MTTTENIFSQGQATQVESVAGSRIDHSNPEASSSLIGAPGLQPAKTGRAQSLALGSLPRSGEWFIASAIALALATHKKKIHRLAQREAWPSRTVANRLEYQPPPAIAEIILAAPGKDAVSASPTARVCFADLVASDSQRELTLRREEAVLLFRANSDLGKETALSLVANAMKQKYPLFKISVSSLRRWDVLYSLHNLDGLVEQKRGHSGRKAFALDLDQSDVLRTAAGAIEHGIKGRLNVARAYRSLVADPTVNGPARAWLHGDHASKSYVPPSVRAAVRDHANPLTTKLVQIGPKAAKLDGPYTECTYDNVPAGKAFTADDMTANVYVWVEWPCAEGFLLIRPQLLAVMDIGSMAWLNVRVVMRAKGQYTKDDVWGLIGDTLDAFGLFDIAVLEGGTWQSDVVIGSKTSIDDKDRFGGLESLGVKVVHTRTPKGKIIETAFNSLQHAMDNCRGFCGRMEMKDCPESVKKQLAEVRAGKAHPRQYFMHINEFKTHVAGTVLALNNERNDGKILRGETPWGKWAAEKPELRPIPDSAKWLYRSSYRVIGVTRNGVRVTMGTGKYQQAYTYSAPALDNLRGRRVVVYWNDYNPDTDAVIYTIKAGHPHQFICVAPRLPELPRFGATEEQSKIEATRKKLAHNLAISQSASMAPYLQRSVQKPGRSLPQTNDSPLPFIRGEGQGEGSRADCRAESNDSLTARLSAAAARAESVQREKQTAQRRTAKLIKDAEPLSALSDDAAPSHEASPGRITLSELSEL